MIEESGRVVNVDADGIWVETVKASACASCAARNGCGQKLLASAGAGKRFVFTVSNPDQLQVNSEDSVLVGIAEGAFMKATLFIYLIPLLALIGGALTGQALGFSEGWLIIVSLLLFVMSLLVVKFSSSYFFSSCQYQPRLLRVIESKIHIKKVG